MKKIPILMPQMGQSIAEGKLLAWNKKPGDQVNADEPLAEVETDKTTTQVESPAKGKIDSLLKQEGDMAAAGDTLGWIVVEETTAEGGAAPERNRPHAGAGQEAVLVTTAPDAGAALEGPSQKEAWLSPSVVRLAREHGLSDQELKSVQGSGGQGRITRTDLVAYVEKKKTGTPVPSAPIPPGAKVVPMTARRKAIAEHMVRSLQTSAHAFMIQPCDWTKAVSLRKTHKNLTYTAVALFLVSRVIKRFPALNAQVSGTNTIFHEHVHLGCAVALGDDTLVVPVVRNADKKSYVELSKDLDSLIAAARHGKLKQEDLEGGTLTLTNFGGHGSTVGVPIINQPQSAILGLGSLVKTPVFRGDQVVAAHMMNFCLSIDHRIVDGVIAGKFLKAMQEAVEGVDEKALGI